jgi:hypothetical protein
MKMKTWGKIAFAALLFFWFPGDPVRLWAQVTAGFSQVGSVPFGTNTFTDTTVTAGTIYQYEVLSQNAAAISTPSNVVTAAIIPSGTGHTATLTWTPPNLSCSTTTPPTCGVPTTYLIERMAVLAPNPPVVNSPITVTQNKAAPAGDQVARVNLKVAVH